MANALAPLGGGGSDDSVHGGDMNGCRSLWLWLQWSTIRTGPLRTTPYEARRQSPEPERWRSASCTARRGARSLLHRGRGQHLLVEVQPQGAMVQHSGIFELEQILDVPVLQMVEQPVEVDTFFRLSLPAVAEQVIEVPKLALPGRAVPRAALSEPQLVEQLVEVPTVLSYSFLKQRTAEQVVDSPVLHGRGRGARGGLQGSSQGQGSTAVCGADEVVSPALHARGGGARGGLQGLSPGLGSTAFGGADNVVSPALHAREGRARGGLHGSSQGQSSTAVCGADFVVSSASHGRVGGARGGLQGLSQGQGSTAVYESRQRSAEQNVDIPAPSFRSRRARRTAEQNVDIPVRRSRAHGGLQGSTARVGAQGASWLRRGDEELEARLYAELDALQANYLELSPQQMDRFDEILRELEQL